MPPRLVSPRWSEEETDDPVYADQRNFFKVERWTADEMQIAELIWAGNNLSRARAKFDAVVRKRPRGHYMIRQGIRIVRRWPERGP